MLFSSRTGSVNIKNETNLAAMRRAGRLASECLAWILAQVEPGMSPGERWAALRGPNLDSTYLMSAVFLPVLTKSGHGAIVNISSTAALHGNWGLYCAAKAGILGLTRSVAREVVTRGIRVNAIAPGWIDTEMTAPLEDNRAQIAAQTPMGRFGEPDDIAWAAVYLASDEAAFVTGQVLSPNGGWYMSQ